MKKYELLATIKPNLDNDEADKVIAKIEESVSSLGGSVINTDKMGRKKLAYDVKGFRDGFMAVLKINLDADKVVEYSNGQKVKVTIKPKDGEYSEIVRTFEYPEAGKINVKTEKTLKNDPEISEISEITRTLKS